VAHTQIKLASEKGTDAFKPGASETYTITTSDCSYVSEVRGLDRYIDMLQPLVMKTVGGDVMCLC
jgi:hypothetical protein